MGIYIKEMTMPQNGCSRCFNDECLLPYSEYVPKGNRHPNCPLIEVKTPHGRLIDTNALARKIVESNYGVDFINKTTALIIDTPTVIEAEVE